MCGICGIYGSNDNHVIRSMTEALAHRGPDSLDYISIGRHFLGGARLHITGDQDAPFPFISPQGGPIVLLNGEIYNYRYCQRQLSTKGYNFITETDTEVVWAMYQEFGPDFTQHLKGMFAIAILDGDNLILTRDRMGIKPLNFICWDGKLAFASEIKALLRISEITPELNLDVLQEVLTFGYINSSTETLFNGIKQVAPGETVYFDGQALRREQYAEMPISFSSPVDQKLLTEKRLILHQLLPAAMETILLHDPFPKGVMLSGGVDSTLMAILVKKTTGRVTTFSLADSEFAPDLQWARRVAKSLGSKHFEFKVTLRDYLRELPRFVFHYENVVAGGVFDLLF